MRRSCSASLLHATRFGRYLFTIGSNREAARFSGVPDTRVRVTIFALSGLHGRGRRDRLRRLLRLGAGRRGPGSLLDVVTAVVLGGVNIFGGAGSMLGVFLALILVAVLRNGMQLANLGGDTQNIVIGVLLLAAILAGNVVRAAQAGGFAAARSRRKEVVRDDAAEAALAVPSNSRPPKGRR